MQRKCDYCQRLFTPWRGDQHLCGRKCHDAYFVRQRREAMALYRQIQEARKNFTMFDSSLMAQDEDDNRQVRRA